MSKIAKRFGVTVEALTAANPQIKNPNKIKVGDQITIPVPVQDGGGAAASDGTVSGSTAPYDRQGATAGTARVSARRASG